MKERELNKTWKAGSIVATSFSALGCLPYEHFSIVSDKVGEDGFPMLISARKKTGTVREELWTVVTGGNETRLVERTYDCMKASQVLVKARAMINKWEYSVESRNCEHFVSLVISGHLSSKQIKYGFAGGTLGVVAVATSDLLNNTRSKTIVYVGLGLALATLGVYYARHK